MSEKHARQQIREAVVAVLSGKTSASTRVYPFRVLKHETLPDLTVWTLNDEVNGEYNTKSDLQYHSLDVFIEVRVKALDSIDDALDAICMDIEQELKPGAIYETTTVPGTGGNPDVVTNKYLSELVKSIELEGTSLKFEGEEKAVGLATIKYKAEYRINRYAPETIIA